MNLTVNMTSELSFDLTYREANLNNIVLPESLKSKN